MIVIKELCVHAINKNVVITLQILSIIIAFHKVIVKNEDYREEYINFLN